MPKVTVHGEGESPSDQLVRSALQEVMVEDVLGRKLKLRKPPFMYQFQLAKALSNEISGKDAYMLSIAPALYVAEIDGDNVGLPITELEIDALLERLGEEGYLAAIKGVTEHFGQITGADEAQLKK